MEDCIFCKIISGDMPANKVYEDEHVLAFLDIAPLNPGHTLIVPKKHSEHFLDASQEDMEHVVRVAKKIAPVIMKTVQAEAMNFSTNNGRAAGQIVFHTHFHMIPRFPADGYEPWKREDGDHPDSASLAEQIRNNL